MKKKVLHILGYMGDAGIGKAVSGIVLNDVAHEHCLLCLEETQKRNEIEKCRNAGIKVYEDPGDEWIEKLIHCCDIVILHWWHYPPVASFLAHFPSVSCRMILWSHVSGCNYPYLSFSFLNRFDYVFLTSPCAYENPLWSHEELEIIQNKSSVVYGLSDIQVHKEKVSYELKPGEFHLIYVGTFTKSKLYNGFPILCKEIVNQIPECKFTMLGDDSKADWVKQELCELGIEKHFEWKGFVEDVYEQLRQSDVFFYPLNPFHFGTTENVILEAMAVGLPIVLFRQSAEKYIVQSNVDGLLSDSEKSMVNDIVRIYQEERLREQLGSGTKNSFQQRFSICDNVTRFHQGLEEMMKIEKSNRTFLDVIGETPAEWFTSAMLPEHRRFFEIGTSIEKMPAIFSEKTKSSVYHFLQYFHDEKLSEYAKKLESED